MTCPHIDEALYMRAVAEADLVIMTPRKEWFLFCCLYGEKVDGTNINLGAFARRQFIQRAAEFRANRMVGIHFDGRPISSDAAADQYLMTWHGIPQRRGREAVVKVLIGEYNPGGRLPASPWPDAGSDSNSIITIQTALRHHQGESIGFKIMWICHIPKVLFWPWAFLYDIRIPG